MTDKQFNFILSRLKNDIIRSLNDKVFKAREPLCGGYIEGVPVVCIEDAESVIEIYFSEVQEDEK